MKFMVAEQQAEKEELAEVSTSNEKIYQMDKDTIEVQIKIGASKHPYTHILRKPTFEEEAARERKMPLITSDAGKVDGADASSMTIDDEPANVFLYDKIITGIKGYALKQGEKASEDVIDPNTTLETPDGPKTIKELIPASHKSTAIVGMFPSNFKVDVEDEDSEFTFALGGGREWRVRQEMGGKIKQEDGTLSAPDYTIIYTFREPSESERKKFRSEAIIALNLRDPKTGSIKERRSTNLKILKELFESLLVSIEGASIGGGDIQAGNREHMNRIPSDFKKGSVIRLFNFLEADLGN